MSETQSALAGQVLVAMPGMTDPRFAGTVIYLCAHSGEGALGLIVNKPTPEVRFAELLEQLGIESGGEMGDIRVYFGGPVEPGRGFVLHSADYTHDEATLEVDPRISLTATTDILRDIASGKGPAQSIMALGYSGWAPGQLEGELARSDWIVAQIKPEIVFGRACEHKWSAALKGIGIDPASLSSSGGTA